MKAARFYGKGDIRVEEIPEPEPGPGEIKIKLAWNGICGSDLHEYVVGASITPREDRPHPISGAVPPVTMGHEMSGTIYAIGSGLADAKHNFRIGQKAVVDPVVACNRCHTCQSLDAPNLCQNLGLIGLTGWGGGLAEYICVAHEQVHIVPDKVPLEVAACVEPLTVAWHAVNCSGFKPGNSCFIAGTGPIGLFLIKVLKARGAGLIYVSEPAKTRREQTLKSGADVAIDPTKEDAEAEVMHKTSGVGVDVSFDCAGVSASLNSCVKATRYTGTICVIALFEAPASLEINYVLMGEKKIVASCCNNKCFPDVIAAIADGKLEGIPDLVTRRIPLKDVVAQGFEGLVNDRKNQIKILVGSGP